MKKHVRIQIFGKVQGVGFRPFVYLLATKLNLSGYAVNRSSDLNIFLYGENENINSFEHELINKAPKHAFITNIIKETLPPPFPQYQEFTIEHKNEKNTLDITPIIPADRALCSRCLSELFTPKNQRFLYPFISCVACGPRSSIILKTPYDRVNTSYQNIYECSRCQNESLHGIQNQTHRFHSQTNACWQCGPSLSLFHRGEKISVENQTPSTVSHDYFDSLAKAIFAGKIIAIKGIGGFHLVCDARNASAIRKLRAVKNRPEKPFAVMALNVHSLQDLVYIDKHTCTTLESDASPIVLIPKKSFSNTVSETLAPKLSDLGCMLPNTAIHYLLFYALLGKPAGLDWLSKAQNTLLVITSANISGEPLITNNSECVEKMSDIADYILCHDRNIMLGCDDSIQQSSLTNPSQTLMVRRARGYAPEPITFPYSGKSVLAFGAHLKHTFCLSDGKQAFLSPHLGEPNSLACYQNFENMLNQYLRLFSIEPEVIACDSHPDFFSTQLAKKYAQNHQLPLVKVPHHRAHIAATLVESNVPVNTPFIGLALDGIGLGESDYQANPPLWGGELFLGEVNATYKTQLSLTHHAQLSKLHLPGGDIATKEIGRIGYALLNSITSDKELSSQQDFSLSPEARLLIQAHYDHFPKSSALGRWFDGVSSLLNIRQKTSYEGQAAMELETLAKAYGDLPKSKHLAEVSKQGELNLYPILPAVLAAKSTQEGAAIFHSELIDGVLHWLISTAQKHHIKHVVCSGGCFQNRLFRYTLFQSASQKGLTLHLPKHIPVNDAGISIGQAFMASLSKDD